MFQGIYNSAAAADALQRWSDVVARNVGTGPIPGYKKDVVSFDRVAMGTIGFDSGEHQTEQVAAFLPVPRMGINFLPGTMQYNGDNQSFAIDGDGFFKLQRPDGSTIYTRDGEFKLSNTGMVMSKGGYNVVGEAGPIQVLIDGGQIRLDPEGRVFQGDQEIGQLSIYDVSDRSALRRTSGGFVIDPERVDFVQENVLENVRARQGFIEESNVNAIHEMIDLVTISNALQANHKVIQTYDGLSERAVQNLNPA